MGSWCGGSVYRQVTNSLQLQRPPSQNDASSCEQRLCGRVPDLGGGADPVHPPLGGMAALQPPAVGRRCAAIDPVRALPPSSQYCPILLLHLSFAQTDKAKPLPPTMWPYRIARACFPPGQLTWQASAEARNT